ncbi:MAG TPA: aminotransferase class V-fold PLP-dependent enzyme [Bryobacteraceae bacterium]|jgi:kynureninase|nr:aminotransferase class V-fold PLP-dependent enzyme [Bryobacteraceae bacterium]
MTDAIAEAIAALGNGPLNEPALARQVFPLFSKVLDTPGIYLANHSLGRPLDQTSLNVSEAVALWQRKLGNAWDDWLAEQAAFRSRLAKLIGAPRVDCIVPKTSAGQGLRTVLNALPGTPRVVTTRGEFDSVDLILKQYAAQHRIQVRWIDPDENGRFHVEPLIEAAKAGADLAIVSQVMFMTGQVIHGLDRLADASHASGARLLIDAYHAIGVFPVDVAELRADFVIGGSYKYLRGGPGACFLYISPEALASGLAPLDVGWFGKRDAFLYQRPEPPQFASGGDAFLESTPPVVTYYQARAGQQFTLAIGVRRIREYHLDRLARLKRYLTDAGIESTGADADHGAFLTIRQPDAASLAAALAARGIHTDARGSYLRLCPDLLSRDEELKKAADVLSVTA